MRGYPGLIFRLGNICIRRHDFANLTDLRIRRLCQDRSPTDMQGSPIRAPLLVMRRKEPQRSGVIAECGKRFGAQQIDLIPRQSQKFA